MFDRENIIAFQYWCLINVQNYMKTYFQIVNERVICAWVYKRGMGNYDCFDKVWPHTRLCVNCMCVCLSSEDWIEKDCLEVMSHQELTLPVYWPLRDNTLYTHFVKDIPYVVSMKCCTRPEFKSRYKALLRHLLSE